MRDRSSESIELPNRNHIETTAICIRHQSVEFRSRIGRTRDSFVNILASDFPLPVSDIFSEFCELHFGLLAVFRRNTCVDRDFQLISFHLSRTLYFNLYSLEAWSATQLFDRLERYSSLLRS